MNCHTYEYTVEYRPLLAQDQQQADFQEIVVGVSENALLRATSLVQTVFTPAPVT